MNNKYVYIILEVNRKNGEVRIMKIKKESKLKEINDVYKKLNLKKNDLNNDPILYQKNFGAYDYTKKSILDDKTTVKAENSYYGRLV
ncbi:MAG TPA: hypothetical protein IAD49_06905 [Candidatus Fimihabitans intestinipullorum]|uniref:Uncharacterized protein n=1 Tax=Candidatus Fimihabitans intestinipullorum TaxID=2840820 RepID=A0A9D1L4S7_9BACT|nr:hypothetical protein [Candidatus Fimihabitans intestinipullorum]